jgi:glutaredoxin 3
MAARVVVYLTDWCPYCHSAQRLLKSKSVAFEEIDVDGRPELRAWMVDASGQRTVPQIFINSRSVGGFSDLSALDRAGELDGLLAAPPSETDAPLPS